MSNDRGLLFIVSAPSGSGKTTLVERLVQVMPGLRMSRSFTSRPPRAGECDGVDYNFISRERFQQMIEAGDFLEWADLFGNLYGTCQSHTVEVLERGEDLVLVIDVQGARQVRRSAFEHVGIFVLPPSFEVLSARLRRRSKDSEAQIERRLDVARQEVSAVSEYDYVVINDELESAVRRLQSIVEAERSRLRTMRRKADAIIRTFARETPCL
jgi:guanylate kinase